MKIILLILALIVVLSLLNSCGTGYQRNGGDWVWKTNDEYNGVRSHVIVGIDQGSFKVLSNNNFAKDDYQVYFQGKKIKHASPQTFQCLTDDAYGYAKDHQYVFFDNEVILNADPITFEILEFPYARDKNDIYCGTMPMKLVAEEVASFKVTTKEEWAKGTKYISTLAHFLESNPDYAWIANSNIEIEKVIVGSSATGSTTHKEFKGLYEVKKP